jgi:uncharacterized protein (DUF4415 family)|tara:strand:+ start:425 stop:625 length:201 start_codon:yes stop_codon:yes gene_type:complete
MGQSEMSDLEKEMQEMIDRTRGTVEKEHPKAKPRKKTQKEIETSKWVKQERERIAPKDKNNKNNKN